ncbi:MAG: hypothetical protein E7185_05340 [Erysipelotrichaceae bacterium]|nr:hypothetical protein [Erysipelotrichaceae bacterium]
MFLKIVLLLIIVCEIWGITGVDKKHLLKSMIYYTQLSNVAALISAVLLLCFGPAEWIAVFRYLSVCLLIMTCLVTLFVLQPLLHDSYLLLWSRTGFFLHLVCPFLNTLSYVFLETHAKETVFLPPAATLLYGVIMLYMNYIEKVDGPYPFLRIRHQTKTATVIWIIVLLAAMGAISSAVALVAG